VVSVSERFDGRLVIDAKYGVERALVVAVVKPGSLLYREIIWKYLLGYDIIRVEGKERISVEDRERVKETVRRLVGLEIVEEDYMQIVTQCLLEPSAFPPEKILRREYSIAAGMHRDAVTALVDGDVHLAKNVVARDDEVNRLYFLLVRILRTVIQNPGLSEKLGILPIDCLDYRLVASLVESIGDQSVMVAQKAMGLEGVKLEKTVLGAVTKLHGFVFDAHEKALRALFGRDVALAESLRVEGRKKFVSMFREVENVVGSLSGEAAPHVLAVVSFLGRIFDAGVDIADLVMPKTA
jgi:phosphate uptake regulator